MFLLTFAVAVRFTRGISIPLTVPLTLLGLSILAARLGHRSLNWLERRHLVVWLSVVLLGLVVSCYVLVKSIAFVNRYYMVVS